MLQMQSNEKWEIIKNSMNLDDNNEAIFQEY